MSNYARAIVRWHRREIPVCRYLNQFSKHPNVRRYFVAVSRLGDGAIWVSLIVMIAIFADNGPQRALHLSILALLTLAIYSQLKRWSKRPRPIHLSPDLILSTPPLDQFSFPSGHTLHAVSLSIVACSYIPALAIFLLPLALSIAVSRVVLGLHYPTDVVAASILAVIAAQLSTQVAGQMGVY
jgi:undecaprenyl-diphosphatase